MINKYQIKKYSENNADKCWFSVDDNDNIIDKENNEMVCSLEDMTKHMRRKMHCDFEVIYDCHGLLRVTYRCKECGTVIFATEDEYFEPNLCCPVCSDYKTGFEYWTAEDIAKDVKKQRSIESMINIQKETIEADKRYEKRGKYDWQIWSGKIKLPKRTIFLDLECDNLFRTKLKGLKLVVDWAYKEDDGVYFYKKSFIIPISLSALKNRLRNIKIKIITPNIGGKLCERK